MALAYSDYFRKHQRIVFAVLTLIAIFSFILGDALTGRSGSGGGSALGRRARGWFDLGGEPVAIVGGESFDAAHIEDIGFQRYFTVTFLGAVRNEGLVQSFMQAGFNAAESRALPDLLRTENIYRQMGQSLRAQPNVPADVKSLLQRFDDATKTDRFNAALQPKKNSLCGAWLQAQGSDYLTPLSVIEAVYWRQRADDLGVVMPPSAVLDDLLNLAINKLDERTLRAICQGMRQARPVNLDEVLKDLSKELRAMIARDLVQGGRQQTMLGVSEPMHKLAQTTPLDSWDAYVAIKTQLDVSMLPIPVMNKDFVSKVKEPTKEELKAFFEKYKTTLPSKTADTPGFKLPRQYQLELLYGNLRVAQPARKYYEAWGEVLDALNPLAAEMALYADYNKRKKDFIITEKNEDYPVGAGTDKSFVRLGSWGALKEDAQLVTQITGAVAGSMARAPQTLAAGAYLLAPGFRPVSAKEEQALRAADALGRIAAASLSGGLLMPPAHKTRTLIKERHRPFDEVVNLLRYDRTEERSRQLLLSDLKTLNDALIAYGKKYNEARAKWRNQRQPAASVFAPPLFDDAKKQTVGDYIREFAAKRGLVYAGMKQARTEEDLFEEKGDDTALSTYVLPIWSKTTVPIPLDRLKREAARYMTDPRRKLYEGQDWGAGDPKFFELAFTWKVDQTDERVPTFEEAESTVRLAWLQEKARPFAEEAAEALAQEVLNQPDGVRILMDRPNFKIHETIARFRLVVNQAAGGGINYEAAPVPVIEEPPTDLVEQALERLKNPNDHMVVWNRPRTTCYLIILRQREQPSPDDPRAREEFDFKIIVPGIGRQPYVANQSFMDFVQAEKLKRIQTDWTRFLKAHTQFNEKLASETAKVLSSLARGS